MAFPPDVQLVTVTCGSGSDFFGEDATVTAEVVPILGGTLKRLTHKETGSFMVKTAREFKGEVGQPATFTVPNSSQAETWVDGQGNFFKDWVYQVLIVVRSGNGKTDRWTQAFRPEPGQTHIDLDLVPDGAVGGGVSAPAPPVTSVNGRAGAVVIPEAVPLTPAMVAENLTEAAVAEKLPERLSETALSATIDGRMPARPLSPVATPCEILANAFDFSAGQLRIAIAADSTLNDSNDMPRKWALRVGQITPSTFGVYEKQFDATNQVYKAMETVKAGTTIPATGGVVMSDNFNRTSSELVGVASSGGQMWSGDVGFWSADGALAHATSGPKMLTFNVNTPNATVTATVDMITSASANSPNVRIYAGSNAGTVAGSTTTIFAQVAVSTGGNANVSIWKKIGNVNTQLGTSDFSTGITDVSATPQKATLTLKVDIQNITVTLTPAGGSTKTYNHTITEADYAALGMWFGVTTANNALDAVRVDNITIETPYTPPKFTGIEIWNGAVGGSNLPYQQARLELLYPAATPFDILLVSGGHNKGVTTPTTFIAEVDAFIAAFKAVHPETKILISSQNPQKAPAATIDAHAARQAALRAYAMDKGYEYLPVFEAFTAQADKGLSMILSDGIHPTYPGHPVANAGLTSLAWEGSVLWASVWLQAINSRRITNALPMKGLPPA